MDHYAPFLLDSNIYALFFQYPTPPALLALQAKIQNGTTVSFYIPEIVSMEIHSVLGKYARAGVDSTPQKCERMVQVDGVAQPCTWQFIKPERNRIKPRVLRAMVKLIADIEAGQGDIRAKILPLEHGAIAYGKQLLIQHANKHAFGSHDALVAGTLLAANASGMALTLVTADKGLKAACRAHGIAVFDPSA